MGFLNDLVVRIKGDKTHLDTTLKGAEGSVNKFGGTVKMLGGLIAAAFSVREIVNFTGEAIKLGAEVEGVRNAFNKITGSASLMNDMLRATRGAMDDSDLMSLAIKAKNFNIPLQDLSKYLEFATNRAITTGKSVAELTNIMVTGLGRGSAASRAFIQLGLSATDVQKAMKETGGMMRLINEELDKMGPVSDTAAVRLQSLSVSFKNMKESFGEWMNQSNAVRSVIQWFTDEFKIFADKDLSLWQKLNGSPNEYKEWKSNVENAKKMLGIGGDLSAATSWKSPWQNTGMQEKQIETLTTLNEQLKLEKEALNTIDISDKAAIRNQVTLIQLLEKRIKLLTEIPGEIPRAKTGNINMPSFGLPVTGLSGAPTAGNQSVANQMGEDYQKVIDETEAMIKAEDLLNDSLLMQERIASSLTGVFERMFLNMDKGFKGMIDGFIEGLKRLAAELAAKAATFLILTALFPEGAIAKAGIGSFMGFGSSLLSGKSSGGGLSSAASSGPLNINVVGKVHGKDLALVLQRWGEDNG